jgi:uncharacterized membrane-anchored protein YitT (DUF2179 family)
VLPLADATAEVAADSAPIGAPHSWAEDIHALLVGSSFAAVGVVLLKSAGLITGGVAGLALTLAYLTHWPVGALFFGLTVPFFAVFQRRMGWGFTLRSLAVTAALASLTAWIPNWLSVKSIDPVFAAVFGGTLIGMGVLALARHHASVGGVGLLALFLYETRGINAGKTQLAADFVILLLAGLVVDLTHLLLSIVSAGALSLVMIAYHRPGRYTGY